MLYLKVFNELLLPENIIIDSTAATRNLALEEICNRARENGLVTGENKEKLFGLFLDRENQSSTAFEEGFAVPHARDHEIIKKSGIYIWRARKDGEGVEWQAMDGKKTNFAFAIILRDDEKVGNLHMDVLSGLSVALIDEDFRKEVWAANSAEEIINIIIKKLFPETQKQQEAIKKTAEISDVKSAKHIVAVTACPVGIAHTYMAAEALEKYAKLHNFTCKVEKQGAKGPEDILTNSDIENADYVILALGKGIDQSRFHGKKVHTVTLKEAIRDPGKCFADGENAKVMQGTINKSSGFDNEKVSVIKHLMAGISYMIPFVITAGILLSITIGFGSNKTPSGFVSKPGFWTMMQTVGVQGFTLMIPILAGFIANSIASRAAIAPAMILSYALNMTIPIAGNSGAVDSVVWNWTKMQFGNFDTAAFSPAPGFFGAIAIGLLMGYTIKQFNRIVFPKFIRPIVPIMIIPILFTFVGWILFSFFLSWPFIGLSIGLKNAINALNDARLMPIVALLLGFMVAFDMGGPVNKIAFVTAISLMTTDHGETMAYVACAIGIPPLICGLAYFGGKYIFKMKFDEADQANGISALLLSIFGITEGAIPWAIKYPKYVMTANIVGASLGAFLLSVFGLIANEHITDGASHGGLIVYIVGAIGQSGGTDYVAGLFYVISILAGGVIGAMIIILWKKHDDKKIAKGIKPFTAGTLFKTVKQAFHHKKNHITKKEHTHRDGSSHKSGKHTKQKVAKKENKYKTAQE